MPDLPQILLFGTLAISLLVGGIVLFVIVYQKRLADQQIQLQQFELNQQKQLLRTSIQSEELERRRIAADLHDEVSALLNTARLGITQLVDEFPKESKNLHNSRTSGAMIGEALEKIRNLSKELKPPVLDAFGLVAGLRELCNKSHQLTGIAIDFVSEGEQERVESFIEISLYRVVSELLQNSIKHAAPSLISVRLFYSQSRIKIQFQDDGKGFNYPQVLNNKHSGSGLRNIHSRIQAIQGTIEFNTMIRQGMSVKISVNL